MLKPCPLSSSSKRIHSPSLVFPLSSPHQSSRPPTRISLIAHLIHPHQSFTFRLPSTASFSYLSVELPAFGPKMFSRFLYFNSYQITQRFGTRVAQFYTIVTLDKNRLYCKIGLLPLPLSELSGLFKATANTVKATIVWYYHKLMVDFNQSSS